MQNRTRRLSAVPMQAADGESNHPWVERRNPGTRGLTGLVKPDATEQVRKTGVGAYGIKERMYFEKFQNV